MAPLVALFWYLVAFIMVIIGNEQRWMIIIAPFLALWPLGGEKNNVSSVNNSYKPDDTFEENRIGASNHSGDAFFECLDQPEADTSDKSRVTFFDEPKVTFAEKPTVTFSEEPKDTFFDEPKVTFCHKPSVTFSEEPRGTSDDETDSPCFAMSIGHGDIRE
jgi:hypothetical protein